MAPPAQSIEQEPADVTAEVLCDHQINHVHKIRPEPLDAHSWDRPQLCCKTVQRCPPPPRKPACRQEKTATPQPNSRRRTNQQRTWRCTASNMSDVSPSTSTSQGRRLASASPVLARHAVRMCKLCPATLPRHELGAKGSPLWSCRG